ncbi:velvet factor-domain-containing protein [Gorgonomyces haynaldii]|nr:velvet factor-domain-containing protein [Gorgonomyces haynaldii]
MASAFEFANMPVAAPATRSNRRYILKLRQQPKHSRMCGFGEKVDRRPVDPPPIIQLFVENPDNPDDNNFIYNPHYFLYASLIAGDSDEELHLLRDGKTRSTAGSIVSSLFRLKDTSQQEGAFFVFPDLSIRMEGVYRLKFSLFEIVDSEIFYCTSITSDPFNVFTAKKFPGMGESTQLSKIFAEQGLKIRIRKEVRNRQKSSKRNYDGDSGEDDNSSRTDAEQPNSPPREDSSSANPPKKVKQDAPRAAAQRYPDGHYYQDRPPAPKGEEYHGPYPGYPYPPAYPPYPGYPPYGYEQRRPSGDRGYRPPMPVKPEDRPGMPPHDSRSPPLKPSLPEIRDGRPRDYPYPYGAPYPPMYYRYPAPYPPSGPYAPKSDAPYPPFHGKAEGSPGYRPPPPGDRYPYPPYYGGAPNDPYYGREGDKRAPYYPPREGYPTGPSGSREGYPPREGYPSREYPPAAAPPPREGYPPAAGPREGYPQASAPRENYPPTAPRESYAPPPAAATSAPRENYPPPTASPRENYQPAASPRENYPPAASPREGYIPPPTASPREGYAPPPTASPREGYLPPPIGAREGYAPPPREGQREAPPSFPPREYSHSTQSPREFPAGALPPPRDYQPPLGSSYPASATVAAREYVAPPNREFMPYTASAGTSLPREFGNFPPTTAARQSPSVPAKEYPPRDYQPPQDYPPQDYSQPSFEDRSVTPSHAVKPEEPSETEHSEV